MVIILTAEDAGKVRGRSPSDKTAALDPVPLKDGTFLLGEEVLADPAHADVRDLLAALPVKEIDPALIFRPDEETPEGEADKAALEVLALPDWKAAGTRSIVAKG
jgi:hypothetical protein